MRSRPWLALRMLAATFPLLLPILVAAQDPSPSSQTFTSNSELVMVPVEVVDAGGHPVHGLKKEDFVLKSDGTPVVSCYKQPATAAGTLPMLQKRIDDQPTISREMMREAEAVFHDHLKRVGLKRTGQRDTILRTFLDTRDHLSTDELYRLVRKKDAGIGFTTVYRTLKLLADSGLASEVAFNDGIARYEHQYQRRNHHHMVCTDCGSSVEFFSTDIERIEQEIGRQNKYLPTRHTFQIYGICDKCQKKQKRA